MILYDNIGLGINQYLIVLNIITIFAKLVSKIVIA